MNKLHFNTLCSFNSHPVLFYANLLKIVKNILYFLICLVLCLQFDLVFALNLL